MEISLLQAFALGIIAFIAGLDMFNGLTHMHRPVVLGPLVGLVLGDLHTGILTGGTLELVWMGLAPLAGAQPPNVIIGTIVGTAFAITTGVKPDVAVGVAVPFAVAVQMGITFLFSVMSGAPNRNGVFGIAFTQLLDGDIARPRQRSLMNRFVNRYLNRFINTFH